MRIQHAGGAKTTTLASDISSTDMVIPCVDLAGWPDGSVGPFYACLEKGLSGIEKVLCSGLSGNTLQVATNGRGVDGTVAQAHAINAPIEHVWTATEADQANAHIESTTGAHGMPDPLTLVTLTGSQDITGQKTMNAPILIDAEVSGGQHTAATIVTSDKILAVGVQAEGEFRVRNTYIGSGPPSTLLGNDGDMYIDKG